MAKQIDKKWIADGAIDGSKIKLLQGQSLVIEVDGQSVELLKLNENGNASLPQGEVPSTQAVNDAIATEVTALNTQIQTDIQTQIAAETTAREAAISSVEQSVAAETQARESAISSVEQSVQSAQTDISGLESGLAQEVLDRQSGDASTLSSAQAYADQKIADLVNSAPEVLDTLKELSDALGGDANFATTVASQIGSVNDKVDQEILDRQSADASTLSSAQAYVDQKISEIPSVDLTNYYTKSEVDSFQSGVISDIDDLDAYAQDTRADLDNLDAYVQDLRFDFDSEASSLNSRIESLENAPDAVIFEEDKKFEVDGINVNSSYIDLPHLAKAILKVGVNRLNAYKNQDYTVSEVGGVTRITWANDLAANGLSEIAGGDFIYVTYAR